MSTKKEPSKKNNVNFNSSLLKNEDIKNNFREKIELSLTSNMHISEIDKMWEKIRTSVTEANTAVINTAVKKEKKKVWFVEECETAARSRIEARQKLLNKENEKKAKKIM